MLVNLCMKFYYYVSDVLLLRTELRPRALKALKIW